MNKKDKQRLQWLMDHYGVKWRTSHAGIRKERLKYDDGILPDSRPHDIREFEGPFFCRIISELMRKDPR